MFYYLPNGVQVRKEIWGLLFYSQTQHKILFVKSADWLYPRHFDGTWTFSTIVDEVSTRTGTPRVFIENTVRKCIGKLLDNGTVANELC